jgi:hypothetical protein
MTEIQNPKHAQDIENRTCFGHWILEFGFCL